MFIRQWNTANQGEGGFMKRIDRRSFIVRAAAVTSVLALTNTKALADVDESDAVAVALGYKADSKKVDSSKYPNHDVAQLCGNCKVSVRRTRLAEFSVVAYVERRGSER